MKFLRRDSMGKILKNMCSPRIFMAFLTCDGPRSTKETPREPVGDPRSAPRGPRSHQET